MAACVLWRLTVIQMLLRITATTERAATTLQALHHLVHGIRRGDQFAQVRVALDAEEDGVIWVSEDWPTVEQFERHLQSEQFTRLLALVETSAAPPLFECRSVSESRGLEYIAALRNATEPPMVDAVPGPARLARDERWTETVGTATSLRDVPPSKPAGQGKGKGERRATRGGSGESR